MTYFSIFSNPTYINIAILCILVFLVLFLWRKLTILEGNFFILEKRVNLIKKDSREKACNRKFENANLVMNEIFNNMVSEDIMDNIGKCNFESCEIPQEDDVKIVFNNTDEKNEDNIKEPTESIVLDNPTEPVEIVDMLESKISFDVEKPKDNDTVSISSDIMFNTDDKYSLKKLSKMNLDKLKDVCISLNLPVDGTKSQMINRILEVNKNITIE